MALDIFAKYATDPDREVEGEWFDLDEGARVLVARSGNRRYAKLLSKLYERHRKVLELGTDESEGRSEEIMIDVMAETILLGWEGITYRGKELTYSVENAKKLLGHRDFRRTINTFAEDMTAYLVKLEADQGEA